MTSPLLDVLEQLRACRWVDLTHSFGPGIPHFHAFPDEERTTLFHYDEGVGSLGHGFLAHQYNHIGQWGTHMDPPAHFIRGGRFQDEIPVEEMILPLVVLDVRAAVARDSDFTAGPAVIETYEREFGRIPEGAFVALSTGWSALWPDSDAMHNRDDDAVAHYPGWDAETLRLLVEERGITAIGHDTTDTDPGVAISAGTFAAETYILAADRWQIELLANLEQVPASGALVVVTWPKPLKGSGFPARVFAIVPN
jgi:kynurenine formamidase